MKNGSYYERVGEVVGYLEGLAGSRSTNEDWITREIDAFTNRHRNEPDYVNRHPSVLDSDGRMVMEEASHPALDGALLVRHSGSRFEFIAAHRRLVYNVQHHDPESLMQQLSERLGFTEVSAQDAGLPNEPQKGKLFAVEKDLKGHAFSLPTPDINKAILSGYKTGCAVASTFPESDVDDVRAERVLAGTAPGRSA